MWSQLERGWWVGACRREGPSGAGSRESKVHLNVRRRPLLPTPLSYGPFPASSLANASKCDHPVRKSDQRWTRQRCRRRRCPPPRSEYLGRIGVSFCPFAHSLHDGFHGGVRRRASMEPNAVGSRVDPVDEQGDCGQRLHGSNTRVHQYESVQVAIAFGVESKHPLAHRPHRRAPAVMFDTVLGAPGASE